MTKQWASALFVMLLALVACIGAQANNQDPIDFTGSPRVLDRGLIARRIERDISRDLTRGQLPAVAERTDQVINTLITLAARQMERRGHEAEAAQLRFEFGEKYRGFLVKMMAARARGERNIGDHKPLSDWLAKAYDKINAALGDTICGLLHLSDLKTLNFGIPVVFHPCDFPMDSVTGDRKTEYRRHFSGKADGEALDGFVPVVSYWLTWAICEAATWGGGWFIICSPLGTLVEVAEERWLTPKLSDAIFEKACGQ